MAEMFDHGYALLIGVGECEYPKWSLKVTVRDMRALQSILTDAALCAYPDDEEHMRLLHDAGATQEAILDGLVWLRRQAREDPQATAVVYFSGHGWLDKSTGRYYLLPHEVEPFDIPGSGLPGDVFSQALQRVPAKRLLVFVDSCWAEGMAAAKDEPAITPPPGFAETTAPDSLVHALKQGEGRAVFTSSRGTQRSWVHADGSLSIYTYHLIEALQGAGNQPGDTMVRISNLMNYLGKTVPETARRQRQAEQTPFFDAATEDFPVAMLRGGKGLPSGGWETVQADAAETMRRIELRVTQTISADRGATITKPSQTLQIQT